MQQLDKKAPHTDFQVILFIISLCFICGLLLSVVAYTLRIPQKEAKEFDQSKQMLIAAKILNHIDEFEILEKDGTLIPAAFDAQTKVLVGVDKAVKASDDQIKEISATLIRPLLTNDKGEVFTFKSKNLTLTQYLADNQKTGYANLPNKLFFAILQNEPESANVTAEDVAKDLSKVAVFVVPISGFGLWGPIYGYLAIGPNGDNVIGTTWYDHGETPGLGANIAEAGWQKQFFNKLIFQESQDGTTDFQTTDMGLIVVKGKVVDVFRDGPKSKSAVDGISGATLTGNGVSAAYKDSLTPYREFFIKVNQEAKDE